MVGTCCITGRLVDGQNYDCVTIRLLKGTRARRHGDMSSTGPRLLVGVRDRANRELSKVLHGHVTTDINVAVLHRGTDTRCRGTDTLMSAPTDIR